MTDGGYTVDVVMLARHGADVGAVAGKIREAAVAGSRLGPDAYGLVGRVFSGAAIRGAQGAARAVTTLADAGARTAQHLGEAAAAYAEADRRAAGLWRTVGR